MNPVTQEFREIVGNYMTRIQSFSSHHGDPSHFRHTTGNILLGMDGLVKIYESDQAPWSEKDKQQFQKIQQTLDAYLGLIERYPLFKEAELTKEHGYLQKPELTQAEQYIIEAIKAIS